MQRQTSFEEALKENALSLTQLAIDQMLAYLVLLKKWNRVFNLTQITRDKEMIYLHLIDSLSVSPYIIGDAILDVGSGAGLPGIPLAITFPEKKWTLLDKNGKKTRFLTQVIAELNLSNVTIVQSRSEDFHPVGCFDSILSRAYGNLKWFVQTTAHLLCSGGKWISMKGKYPATEMAELSKEWVVKSHPISLKGVQVERHIVCISK